MINLERSIEVEVPASQAYAIWTRFELLPQFMEDVEDVQQENDLRLHWRANLWGRTEEWDAEITGQIPDKRIAWRSSSGARNAGVVTFHRLSDDRCRVMLQLEYGPEGLAERLGAALGILRRRVERDLEGFKEFAEARGARAIEGWQGREPARPDSAQQQGS